MMSAGRALTLPKFLIHVLGLHYSTDRPPLNPHGQYRCVEEVSISVLEGRDHDRTQLLKRTCDKVTGFHLFLANFHKEQ